MLSMALVAFTCGLVLTVQHNDIDRLTTRNADMRFHIEWTIPHVVPTDISAQCVASLAGGMHGYGGGPTAAALPSC